MHGSVPCGLSRAAIRSCFAWSSARSSGTWASIAAYSAIFPVVCQKSCFSIVASEAVVAVSAPANSVLPISDSTSADSGRCSVGSTSATGSGTGCGARTGSTLATVACAARTPGYRDVRAAAALATQRPAQHQHKSHFAGLGLSQRTCAYHSSRRVCNRAVASDLTLGSTSTS
jgi:hypothetical protein